MNFYNLIKVFFSFVTSQIKPLHVCSPFTEKVDSRVKNLKLTRQFLGIPNVRRTDLSKS